MGIDNEVRRRGGPGPIVAIVGVVALALLVLAVVVAVLGHARGGSGASARSDMTSVPSSTNPSTSTVGGAQPPSTSTGGEADRGGTAELQDEQIQDGIIKREYLVMRPSWASRSGRLPLVVALHGLTVDRRAMANGADWRGQVQGRGFVAVFPQGFANSWNVGPCCPPANLVGVNDVAFLDSVITAVKGSENVDPDRVYVTGFSAGGLMAYNYGCRRSDLLAGIAPMAGTDLTGCTPEHPLSLLHQHSDPDLVVPFDGGVGVGQILTSKPLPPVVASVRKWATSIGCSGDPGWVPVANAVDEMSWDRCSDGTSVRLVRLEGRGHEWPRTKDYDGLVEMLDFFGIN